jgi:hypothetical protein
MKKASVIRKVVREEEKYLCRPFSGFLLIDTYASGQIAAYTLFRLQSALDLFKASLDNPLIVRSEVVKYSDGLVSKPIAIKSYFED